VKFAPVVDVDEGDDEALLLAMGIVRPAKGSAPPVPATKNPTPTASSIPVGGLSALLQSLGMTEEQLKQQGQASSKTPALPPSGGVNALLEVLGAHQDEPQPSRSDTLDNFDVPAYGLPPAAVPSSSLPRLRPSPSTPIAPAERPAAPEEVSEETRRRRAKREEFLHGARLEASARDAAKKRQEEHRQKILAQAQEREAKIKAQRAQEEANRGNTFLGRAERLKKLREQGDL
jgi:hypothetical protein